MKLREIHSHTITHEENRLRVYAAGSPGPNGDNHAYLVKGLNPEDHPIAAELVAYADALPDDAPEVALTFQQGDPGTGIYNGYTLETLLAICYDRLNGCQAGPYASEHNAQAMIHINYALEHLHQRTREKLAAAEVPVEEEEAKQAANAQAQQEKGDE